MGCEKGPLPQLLPHPLFSESSDEGKEGPIQSPSGRHQFPEGEKRVHLSSVGHAHGAEAEALGAVSLSVPCFTTVPSVPLPQFQARGLDLSQLWQPRERISPGALAPTASTRGWLALAA